MDFLCADLTMVLQSKWGDAKHMRACISRLDWTSSDTIVHKLDHDAGRPIIRNLNVSHAIAMHNLACALCTSISTCLFLPRK